MTEYQHYRECTLGRALQATINEMVATGDFDQNVGDALLQSFDKSINRRLNFATKKATFQGHLHIYRHVDDVWTFILTDAKFKMDAQQPIDVGDMKIVALDGKKQDH